ncbi:inhibitor of the KinA pathway to sporulation, predicted exonuclease [Desulfosporosinus orientis DSM 765]|uniref:Inhibitor of the KinA pathway to sporulation, predicted exonuclease n=1 Tax=Desulfosporosinus orientis (strain ATCC 19365 / DSM 765 / NCIMB 8382 / VKM B-1628 / Singapore I) TaxID=768706 RepID=G7W7W9_DESOD|nr:3'-5' exonuclease [Desulfosporosinus orientis]AET66395.1 inhibitor of the KinA pathway to sporulation, predicted exonuclease [Desulfosporosinus orientis DSM 765]
MNYIVFDLEFNMFFKFKEGDQGNPALKSEIIQIGAVKLDHRLEMIDEYNSIIRPVIYKRINPYVKKKTNISTITVGQGIPFAGAIRGFSSWVGKDSVLCSWGHDDILGLRENCLFFGFHDLSFDKYINIQQLYMNREGLSKQPSLESAVEDLDIQIISPFHDALSDAFYTAKIFKEIYNFSENAVINWEKIQRENQEKIRELKLLIDKATITCPQCQRTLRKMKEVTKAKKYYAQGFCEQCNLSIRHISRITHSEGKYSILSKNSIITQEKDLKPTE